MTVMTQGETLDGSPRKTRPEVWPRRPTRPCRRPQVKGPSPCNRYTSGVAGDVAGECRFAMKNIQNWVVVSNMFVNFPQ